MNITDRMTRLILARRPRVGARGIRRAIADACGISYEAVRQWFSGNTGSIRNENLIAIAETFDTTIDWLLAGDGEPPHRAPAEGGGTLLAEHVPSLSLDAIASPRSRLFLERIASAAAEGRLSEDDLALLDQIATRLESASGRAVSPDNSESHQRLRNKLRRNDPTAR
ncbi:helix-turn-helix domain-containing protein [Azotobacter salinestris]|uniref:helix-turn-helix domain-containing protein n=1 Tax=Azotobacter salinestris TaxID=69964 RepID=UPI001AD646FD|nr:helix-turn-helix transcriptional regulator [Azotobacter salinestris]